MNIKKAREYFELGVIQSLEALRSPMSSGWLIQINGREGQSWVMQTALGSDKIYASLDTLMGEIEGITGRVTGFTVRI